MPKEKKFSQVFGEALDKIEADARAVNLNLTTLCERTGISRATPDRWRKKPPKTIELLDAMQAEVEQERAREAHEPR